MKSFYGWGKLSGYKTILRIADINKKAAKRSNFFAARALAENSESKVETFNIDDDEGDADAVTVSDPEPSTSATTAADRRHPCGTPAQQGRQGHCRTTATPI